MIVINLHNTPHGEVRTTLESVINGLWASNEELHIITGSSPKMKKIVIDLLVDYKLGFTIGDAFGHNTGFIKTILD